MPLGNRAVAGIATAVGTLALAAATFASTRTANRAAKSTEQLRLEALRPILIPSPWDDPVQKIGFVHEVWLHVAGGRAAMQMSDDAIYLVLSVRKSLADKLPVPLRDWPALACALSNSQQPQRHAVDMASRV